MIAVSSCLSSVNAQESELGFSLLTPGGINFVAKSNNVDFPFQASIGYSSEKTHGVEVGYNFLKNKDSFFRSAQVIVGKSTARNSDWKYAGLSATFQSGNFFIEPGITVGSGANKYSNPEFILQIGWLWK